MAKPTTDHAQFYPILPEMPGISSIWRCRALGYHMNDSPVSSALTQIGSGPGKRLKKIPASKRTNISTPWQRPQLWGCFILVADYCLSAGSNKMSLPEMPSHTCQRIGGSTRALESLGLKRHGKELMDRSTTVWVNACQVHPML